MNLTSITTIAEIESAHRYLVDESFYHSTHANWLELRRDWLSFVENLMDGDTVWEYDDVSVTNGWAAGSRGYVIIRCGETITRFPTSAIG